MDIDLKSTHYTEALPVAPLTINPLTVTPVAVHLKELNQVAPLSIEGLRLDHVRHVDPLSIEQLNITSLPTVNVTMSQLPALDINVRRVPPIAVALQQRFEMSSDYLMTARVLGLPLMTLSITGRTSISPKDCARREQSRSPDRSFPEVAALGNPAIPSRATETGVRTVSRPAAPGMARRPHAGPGAPRFGFSLPPVGPAEIDSAVNGG